jgi:hypothetical protein
MVNHVLTGDIGVEDAARRGPAMTAFRTIAFVAFAAIVAAGVTGSAGSSTGTGPCGPVLEIRDPGLRASFAKFDTTQSPAAAKVCALYRNADLSR